MDPVVIIGAGPAGVAAAYELSNQNVPVVLLEATNSIGGLSRTIAFQGALYDVGPHRFFTRNTEVDALWQNTLGADYISVDRLTRIFYGGHFFDYPISMTDTIKKVGLAQAAVFGFSYFAARADATLRPREAQSFEEWVVSHFGRALFNAFFKTYTEKVWGIPCNQIGAEWAAQRIKGLSLWEAVRNSLSKSNSNAKSLVEQFRFPRKGAGMMYEQIAQFAQAKGAQVLTNCRAEKIIHEAGRVKAVKVLHDGMAEEIACSHVLTSNPITEAVQSLYPEPPATVQAAAKALRYRCHLSANLLVEGDLLPDNWIYVHAKEVVLGRIANYANFSPEMRSPEGYTPLTVEYFQFPDDKLYSNLDDEQVLRFAQDELQQMNLLSPDQVRGGFVVRSPQAYPVLDLEYASHLDAIRSHMQSIENLQPIGRCGMFKYNNQDHSVATGLLAARNITGQKNDVWSVNIDAEYHEAGKAN